MIVTLDFGRGPNAKKKREQNKFLTEQEIKNAHLISNNFLLLTKQEVLKEFEKELSKKYLISAKLSMP